MIQNKRTIIIGAIIGVVIIILGIIGIVAQDKETGVDETGYVDPGSGETIIEDKSPQGTDLSLENSIIYPGFSKLIDRGLSPEQIQSIQSVFAEYSLKQPEKFKEVSLTVDSVRRIIPQDNSRKQTLTFNVKVDRETDYFVSTSYENLTSINTKVYKADKTTLLIEG